ncbi:fimbria/pilus outer membrane usher protein [Escherichia coli]
MPINDIYAAGNSGDLQVTIKEADGSTQIFTVPYSSVPLLQREGHTVIPLRQENTVVEIRSRKTRFFQSTLFHGLPAGWTILVERNWRSLSCFNFGIGKNMGALGALSVDIAQANSTLPMTVSMTDNRCVFSITNRSMNQARIFS